VGKLTLHGARDLAQLWPDGSSDVDTLKVQVRAIDFGGRATRAFDGAYVISRGEQRLVVHEGAVTVRLQGVDAPELHYPTTVPGGHNASYRQSLGGSATVALAEWLRSLRRGSVLGLPRRERARLAPGRLRPLRLARRRRRGRREEPGPLAGRARTRLPRALRLHVPARARGDPRRRPGREAPLEPRPARGDDHARVVYPKLFRRLALCYATQGNVKHLGAFLAGLGDRVLRAPDLQRAQPLARLIDERHQPPRFIAQPQELVFKEADSVLLGPRGASITRW